MFNKVVYIFLYMYTFIVVQWYAFMHIYVVGVLLDIGKSYFEEYELLLILVKPKTKYYCPLSLDIHNDYDF